MAMVQLCCKIPSKEQLLPIPKIVRQNERGFKCHCISLTENSRFSSTSDYMCKRWRSIYPKQDVAELPVQWKMSNITSHVGSFSKKASTKENLRMVRCAAESSDSECQIRILESYLAKLKDDSIQNSSESSGEIEELHSRSGEIDAKTELDSLDAYLGKLNTDAKFSTFDDQTTERNLVAAQLSISKSSKRGYMGKLKGYRELRNKDGVRSLERDLALQRTEETSNLYLISILVSIDIAVFLFEIASPIRNSEFGFFSLPLLYGAKINELILVGEWWRLVTPMFLGPVFAIIGAWLIYQFQNKDVIAKDVSERMFQKAILSTALSFIISNFGPVDTWAHLGAACTGIIYGFLTCPIVQLSDASSRNSQEEGITLIRQYANPCKSLMLCLQGDNIRRAQRKTPANTGSICCDLTTKSVAVSWTGPCLVLLLTNYDTALTLAYEPFSSATPSAI
ncbi:RHOMBOID-like protein 9 [Citrus sinensis]|uniref:RHOMBOID-like protein 9 n=1 Tax=Citrus sinensis TaxID=2711 RepID=A0ACB8K403_CITSI|nr:RHOMBOID-like protein 9 [Citrus sinensis]